MRPAHGRVFFRDDDVGWAPRRLEALLEVFERHGAPVDLAVIPAALERREAQRLLAHARARRGAVGFHQHGYAHANHERAGRRCEFGPSRGAAEQLRDIAQGREWLASLLGPALDPIFTPPWNRCTAHTGAALRALGFRALSCDLSAGRLGLTGLEEIPVCVDWVRERREDPRGDRLRARIAEALATRSPVGVMLHHEEMDDDDLAILDDVLAMLGETPRLSLARMAELVAEAEAACAGDAVR